MDYDKMTKKQLLDVVKSNDILKPIVEMTDISFGHVLMVERIGNVLNNKHHAFMPIITATTEDGDLVITIPNTDKGQAKSDVTYNIIAHDKVNNQCLSAILEGSDTEDECIKRFKELIDPDNQNPYYFDLRMRGGYLRLEDSNGNEIDAD